MKSAAGMIRPLEVFLEVGQVGASGTFRESRQRVRSGEASRVRASDDQSRASGHLRAERVALVVSEHRARQAGSASSRETPRACAASRSGTRGAPAAAG